MATETEVLKFKTVNELLRYAAGTFPDANQALGYFLQYLDGDRKLKNLAQKHALYEYGKAGIYRARGARRARAKDPQNGMAAPALSGTALTDALAPAFEDMNRLLETHFIGSKRLGACTSGEVLAQAERERGQQEGLGNIAQFHEAIGKKGKKNELVSKVWTDAAVRRLWRSIYSH